MDTLILLFLIGSEFYPRVESA